jgi:CO dehydrogenase maturation factor
MTTTIAVAGKGGTGKTTLAGLIIRYLRRSGRVPILAVDADPDSNLPQAIGLGGEKSISTIGRARQDFFSSRGTVPAGVPKEAYLELRLNEVLVETADIDLLVMGRPEGAGCYCYINNVLRKFLETLGRNYPFVVIDNEAGLEHLSRRTAQRIDMLVVVSDYSVNGLRAAGRIRQLSEELELDIGRRFLVINRVPGALSGTFRERAEGQGLGLLGVVPLDESISEGDLAGKALIDLPDENRAVRAVNDFMQKVIGAEETQ